MPAPTGLIQQFDQHLHSRRLLEPAMRLLVACSGGADSVALLRLLHAVNQSRHWNWKLIVGHVNHQLRGRESLRDEMFVRDLAKALDLPFRSQRLNLTRTDQHRAVSENAAREARYKALLAMAGRGRCDAIVLAHHAGDQAETILMRLLRGAGVTGLAGINESDVRGKIRLVRPLLPWPGEQLREWLSEVGQNWREDLSNQDTQFFRNRIRHELLPMLETYQPRIRELLHRNFRHDRAAADFLHEHARQVLRSAHYRRGKNMVSFAEKAIAAAHQAPAALALRLALRDAGAQDDGINTATLLDVLEKLQARALRDKTILFAGAINLSVHHDRIIIRRTARTAERKRRRN